MKAADLAVNKISALKERNSYQWMQVDQQLGALSQDQAKSVKWLQRTLPKALKHLAHLPYDGVEQHEDTLREIQKNLPELGIRKPGPKPKVARKEIILELIKIYEEATSRAAGRSTKPATGEAVGPFVRFVIAAFDYLEITDKNGLDDAIRDAINAHKAAMGKLSEK